MDLTITVISSGNRQSISAAKASRVFAYDQWGFWAGREAYAADLQSFVQQVKQHYIGIPGYLLGESMGGAVVMAAIRDARGRWRYSGCTAGLVEEYHKPAYSGCCPVQCLG